MRNQLPAVALSLCLAVAVAAAPLAAASFDDGRFDPSWVGGGPEFREADEIDYLWVSPGFDFAGTSIEFAAWEEPVWMGEEAEERDAKDKRLANDLSRNLPGIFAEAFRNGLGGKAAVVDTGGALRATGRIVDCSTGSAAAKFWVGMGAGSGSTTFDLKFVDVASGKTMVAVHHRVVSGTSLSTTDSKLVDWVDELAEEIGKKGIESIYRKGDRIRK